MATTIVIIDGFAINGELVRQVRPRTRSDVDIVFDDKNYVTVSGTVEDVAKKVWPDRQHKTYS